MKLRYRILRITFPEVKACYIAQYRIFGIWMNIGLTKNYFTNHSNTFCETYVEAFQRIVKFELKMKRANEWAHSAKTIVYNPGII